MCFSLSFDLSSQKKKTKPERGITNLDVVRRHFQHRDIKVIRNRAQIEPALAVVHKTDADADSPEPARAPDTVEIGLRVRIVVDVCREIVVDYHAHRGHIEAAGEHIGCDEDLGFSKAEGVDYGVASGTWVVEVGVQAGDFVAVCGHALVNFIGGFAALVVEGVGG